MVGFFKEKKILKDNELVWGGGMWLPVRNSEGVFGSEREKMRGTC